MSYSTQRRLHTHLAEPFASRSAAVFVVLGSLALAVRLFDQVSQSAVNILFSDQWDFDDATLFQRHSLWQMFRWQYGPHRQGLGALLAHFLEPHFRWNSRSEAFLATTIVVVAAACALYLKVRLLGPLSFSDVAIPLIFLTPAQFESLWVTPNFAHGPLPLLLVTLYCLALTCERPAVRYGLALTINFLAIYTGFGVLLGLVTPVWLGCEYIARRRAGEPAKWELISLGIALASLGSFFVGYRSEPAADCFSVVPRSPATLVTFFLGMLAHNFGARGPQIFSLPLGSAALTAMIFVLAGFIGHFKEMKSFTARNLVPPILVAYCLLFCAAAAYGRSCMGSHLAFESRYTNYLALGMLGVYFWLYSLDQKRVRAILLGAFLVLILIGSVETRPADRYLMAKFHRIKAEWKSCYLRTEDIRHCDRDVGFGVSPFPNLLKAKLEYLKQTNQNMYWDSH